MKVRVKGVGAGQPGQQIPQLRGLFAGEPGQELGTAPNRSARDRWLSPGVRPTKRSTPASLRARMSRVRSAKRAEASAPS